MHDLASYDDFIAEDAPIWASGEAIEFSARVGVIALLVVVLGAPWDLRGVEFWRAIALTITIGVGLGLPLATLALFLDRRKDERKAQRWLRRVFAGDQAVVPPAPSDAACRLVSSAVLPDGKRVFGILYVLSAELAFQPHYLQRAWWKRGPKEIPPLIHIGPPSTIVLWTSVTPLRHRLLRAVGSRPMPVLICEWAEGLLVFRVPLTDTTCGRLQAQVDDLRVRAEAAV
jgi:hypothetical protein